MNIYVGNLPGNMTEQELEEAFKAFGQVTSVRIVKDLNTGQSRGFGFVDMPAKAEAQAAIVGLSLKDLKGRRLIVSEARPPSQGRQGEERRRW